jgi:dephospho-CoA kinase
MSSIIILIGKAQSGKTTISNYISSLYKYSQIAIADKLKDLTHLLLQVFDINISREDLDNENKEKYRKYLQQIGTDCCRRIFGEYFWIEQLKFEKDKKYIVSDVRFLSEYEYIKNKYKNVTVIKLSRNIQIELNTHISETEMEQIPYDYLIENNESLEVLYENVKSVVNKIIICE